jgi:hypothetical protein
MRNDSPGRGAVGPLHSFLAGTVLLAIFGGEPDVHHHLVVDDSTPRAQVLTQRRLIGAGVASVLVGVTLGSRRWNPDCDRRCDGPVQRIDGSGRAGGVGRLLAGSLAYLVSVLKGSPFEAHRRLIEERPWLPPLALNAAGIGLTAGWLTVGVVLAAAWLTDFGFRLVRSPGPT